MPKEIHYKFLETLDYSFRTRNDGAMYGVRNRKELSVSSPSRPSLPVLGMDTHTTVHK